LFNEAHDIVLAVRLNIIAFDIKSFKAVSKWLVVALERADNGATGLKD
jgi:hypothetical protein